jgi:hypothetical protein
MSCTPVNLDSDLEAVNQLRRRGADLSVTHDVFNYFICRDEDTARHLANWILVWGYEARVMLPKGTHGWQVRATASLEPTPDNVVVMRKDMERLAYRVGAQYDGWEVETVRT